VFRRKKKDEADLEDAVEEQAPVEAAPEEPAPPARPQGPWDVEDAPDDEVNRIDLGGMQVPVPPETEVRVDVSPEGEVVAATLVRGESSMQVNVFAAPRRSGIWDEVRAEIAEALSTGGGRAQDEPGPYGTELHGAVPTEGGGLAPARFVGVDGPRWFLRALLTGPAAQDRAAAAPFEAALKDVVVVRGSDAMAVRDPLPLRLPREVTEQAAAAAQEEVSLEMPERGPEITEIR
jgi:hypothetical protein